MLCHNKVQEYSSFLNYGKLQCTFFHNKDKSRHMTSTCCLRAYTFIQNFELLAWSSRSWLRLWWCCIRPQSRMSIVQHLVIRIWQMRALVRLQSHWITRLEMRFWVHPWNYAAFLM